jgi:hypothetical protein
MADLHRWMRAASFSVVVCAFAIVFCGTARSQDQPTYKVDADWPKQLPNNWIMGQIGGVAVDKEDHVWVLQRPGSNVKDDLGLAQNPPVSICCISAPPVLEFDVEGNLIKSWGGPGAGYDWPVSEHSIFVDQAGNVWITGNGAKDRQAIKFTGDGKPMLQIGRPSAEPLKAADMKNADTSFLGKPAGIEVDEKAHELYVADGYFNRRVIVYDSETGAFKRMWGAYGNPPSDEDYGGPYVPGSPTSKLFRNPVHCVHAAKDGLVYVCDRSDDRIQVFTKEGKFVKEFFVHPDTVGMGADYDIAFSHDAAQKYLLVADGEDNVIWILLRSDGSLVGTIGHAGRGAGQFHHVHSIVMDSKGNFYTGEVDTGRRVQRFMLVAKTPAKK